MTTPYMSDEYEDYYADIAAEMAELDAQHDQHVITYGWHQNNQRLIAAGRKPNPAPYL